jgi:bifunctional pyridoxal-dependent enzyme with beta-cystathionase and maltose regulon repressor activities
LINSQNRRLSDSMKWLDYDEDVLPMWVADMDFVSPPAVLQVPSRASGAWRLRLWSA